ncbi:DNA polymerase beta-like protein [Leptotrombidium deliense]|uniref:DNA polymerase n=1 Tax=Leptotrombidium deliense TaxID=299467 RepID=A0A443SET0_9ACAR|nr:DNA polymerase beta-like protein [Leptotrombidium deliense]
MDNKRTNPNKDICEKLLEIAKYEESVNRNIFKGRAYRKAVKTISELNYRLKSGKEAVKLPSIGKSIAAKIDEFLEIGEMNKITSIHNNERFFSLEQLQRVSGIGPVFANRLVDTGIKNIEELEKNTHLLNSHQKLGLKYLLEFEQKIPRSEVEEIERFILKSAKLVNTTIDLTICGSYRRGCSESGDVDVLVTDKRNKNFLPLLVQSLQNSSFITDTIAQGDNKFMGVCRLSENHLHRRIDIRFFPKSQYYCGILYFTGSSLFNQEMRKHALAQGFTLSEYSLRKFGSTGVPGEDLPITSEKEIFDYIHFPYKEPVERDW